MKKQLFVLIVTLLIISSTIVIISDDVKIKAAPAKTKSTLYTLGAINKSIGLDFEYIENIAKNLSDVIFKAYNFTDLRKGRFFGSKGEHYAAKNIIAPQMENLGLYDLNLTPSYLEQLENRESNLFKFAPGVNLTEQIEVQSFGITIHNESDSSVDNLTDFYIRPMWNLNFFRVFKERFSSEYKFLDFLENVLKIDLEDYYWYNMIFNKNWLTTNFSCENLTIVRRPTNFSWFFDALESEAENISNNESIIDCARAGYAVH